MPYKHITPIHTTVYIKIKSYQLRSNGYPKYHTHPQSYMDLVHSNQWVDKICELPHAIYSSYALPLRYNTTHIRSSLYFHLMNMYYGIYPVDTDVSNFTTIAYQDKTILRLAIKQEMSWYNRNMNELQTLNRTIGFMGFTR